MYIFYECVCVCLPHHNYLQCQRSLSRRSNLAWGRSVAKKSEEEEAWVGVAAR